MTAPTVCLSERILSNAARGVRGMGEGMRGMGECSCIYDMLHSSEGFRQV